MFSDPFGLCKDKHGHELSVKACDKGLESPSIDPVAFFAGGLVGAFRALAAALFTDAAVDATVNGVATAATASGATSLAEDMAGEVADATGGTVYKLAKSEGFKVTAQFGKRVVVARIKAGGDFRVAIDGIGALTESGEISSDAAATHHSATSAQPIIDLMNKAAEYLTANKQ